MTFELGQVNATKGKRAKCPNVVQWLLTIIQDITPRSVLIKQLNVQ